MNEQAETLRDLQLVALRRRGQNRVHAALVMPDAIARGSVLGCPVEVIESATAAFCGRVLRGRMIVMERGQKVDCRECALIAALAMEKARA